LWTVGAADLLDSAVALHEAGCVADAALHAVVREIDARGAAVEAGAHSTAGWLRARLHLHPGAARRIVATARALHDDPAGALVYHAAEPGELPEAGGRTVLRAAFAAGAVSGEHVAVACQTLTDLPDTLPGDVVAAAEQFLAEHAARHDPLELARLGRHLRHTLRTEDDDTLARDEQAKRARQHLDIRRHLDGSSDVRGHLGAELTAELLSQIQPLAAPRPAADGTRDPRTVGQRNADGLAELLRRSAVAGSTPARHGSRATITITMALETLERRLGSPAAMLDWSGPVSAEAARRLACDARLIPVVLGAQGEPLDVGRASYPVTQAIWRALVARDGGCAFNGCDRPPEWTEAHHIRHWGDGGHTSVSNTCLLCDHHHRVAHHDGWQIQLIDGAVHVIPPPWIDPDRKPRPKTHVERAATLHDVPRPEHPDRT
ncbi:MAG: DUF222 domain-containing protein, partial [Nocardioides sp.]